MWATDASYFRVIGWGFYYMVTVMDDFSRFILSWKLQRDMTSDSFIEVVQDAVDLTGMADVPLDDRTLALVSLPSCCSPTMGWLRLPSLRGSPTSGGNQTHRGFTIPSADQWQAGALPSIDKTGGEPGPL